MLTRMAALDAARRRRLAPARVAYLATSAGGRPAIVPIVFVLLGDHVYHAIDAKPKRVPPERLRRIRNLRANPRAACLIEHYEEDWSNLWFALLEGTVRLLRGGPEHGRAIQALRRKYPQYLRLPLNLSALVVALDIEHVREWPRLPRRLTATRSPARLGRCCRR